jgi:hypothetical protein
MCFEALFQREHVNVQKRPFGNKFNYQLWQVLALATLVGGFKHQGLRDICQNPPFQNWYDENIKSEVHSLVNAYLGMDSDSSIFWFGLEPDLLGEYLVLRNWKKKRLHFP